MGISGRAQARLKGGENILGFLAAGLQWWILAGARWRGHESVRKVSRTTVSISSGIVTVLEFMVGVGVFLLALVYCVVSCTP